MRGRDDALAVALLERRGFTAEHLRVFHPGGKVGVVVMTSSTRRWRRSPLNGLKPLVLVHVLDLLREGVA